MSGRVLFMVGSLLLAGGVMVAAAWLGTAPPTDPVEDLTEAPGLPVDLSGLNVNPDDLQAGGQQLALESVEQFEIFNDDGKTITRLTGDEAVPRDDFVADIRAPRAEITFAPERVLTIAAADGTFYYPGREPQRGEFHRDTVVTLYEAPAGEAADLHSNRHVQMRLFLDAATHFDREQGQVRTDGPVRLVGRDVDFAGRGLSLTFNAGQQRVEQLIIEHGEQLRLAAGAAPDAEAETSAVGPPSPVPPPQNPSNAQPESVDAASEPEEPGQAYLITLQGGVDVTVGADGTVLRGDSLRGSFVARAESDDPDGPTDGDTAPRAAPPTDPAMQASLVAGDPDTARTDTADGSGVTEFPIDADDPRALRRPRDDDTVVRWYGRLVLTPDPLPAAEAGGVVASGTRLVLRGGDTSRARVITGEQQSLEADRVGYDADAGRVWAHADGDAGPGIALAAPDVGRLVARGLELNRHTGRGRVTGPGQLSTDDGRLAITFARQLNLYFTPDHGGRDDPQHPTGFVGLREATFVGEVVAHAKDQDQDTSLRLQTHRLTVPFTHASPPPPALTGPRADDHDSITPSPRPAALIATADPSAPDQRVTVTLPDADFSARELTVDLVLNDTTATPPAQSPPPTTTSVDTQDSDAPDGGLGGLAVSRLRARGHVAVQLESGDARVLAHALDADPRQKRLELFGDTHAPARLERRGAELQGAHLILREADQAAEALGPGHFSTPTDTNEPGGEIRVAWTGGMTFENRAGHAFFTGNVVSDAHSDGSRSRLTTHELEIDFVPQNLDAANQDQDDVKASNTPVAGPDRNALDIHRLHASADPLDSDSLVNFTTQTLEGPPGDGADPAPPLTAFTLISRELNFINVVPDLDNDTAVDDQLTLQTVEVPGRGRMLISDYRTPARDDGRAVDFAGAGLTAFAWEGRLTLDALQNDLRMEGQVLMAHEPLAAGDAEPDPPVKLETQVLTADLTETGGLGALAGGPAPDVQLQRVVAIGAVRISRDQARVLADHLDYTAARGNVILTAEPGKLCELRQADQPTSATTARRLVWDLATGVFTAQGVGSGVVPIE